MDGTFFASREVERIEKLPATGFIEKKTRFDNCGITRIANYEQMLSISRQCKKPILSIEHAALSFVRQVDESGDYVFIIHIVDLECAEEFRIIINFYLSLKDGRIALSFDEKNKIDYIHASTISVAESIVTGVRKKFFELLKRQQ